MNDWLAGWSRALKSAASGGVMTPILCFIMIIASGMVVGLEWPLWLMVLLTVAIVSAMLYSQYVHRSLIAKNYPHGLLILPLVYLGGILYLCCIWGAYRFHL